MGARKGQSRAVRVDFECFGFSGKEENEDAASEASDRPAQTAPTSIALHLSREVSKLEESSPNNWKEHEGDSGTMATPGHFPDPTSLQADKLVGSAEVSVVT